MIKSLFRKCFYALLWLWVISMLAFWLSKQVPGDEILDYLSIETGAYSTALRPDQQHEAYQHVAQKRGLDLPLFYFSLHKGIYPKSLFTIFPIEDRQAVKAWINHSRNNHASIELYSSIRNALRYACPKGASLPIADSCCNQLAAILVQPDVNQLHQQANALYQQIKMDGRDSVLTSMVKLISEQSTALQEQHRLSFSEYFPSLTWNGSHNQYHHWITGLLSLQPLASLVDGRNAWTKILEALKWTLILNGLSFLLAIGLGVLIGIWSGVRDGKRKEKWLSVLLFTFFAIPSFWLATLLILLFSSGEWLSILPPGGLGQYHGAHSFLEKWGIIAMHLVLPVFCLTIGSLAYISRQMKQSVLHEFSQPYVSSLRTLGISEKTILKKHVIRNALFPMITMMGNALPAILSGSLIIEVIFSIPGMGRLMFTSLMARDWPVVFPILMLGAGVTIFAYTLTDVVYKWIDPRVKSTE
jgi:peptide/nickel transport system permease protein